MVILNEANLSPMIREAMRHKAPQLYLELLKNGHLDLVVRERAASAMEVYLELYNEVIDQTSRVEEYLPRIQKANQLLRQASEQVIASATEFPTDTEGLSDRRWSA